MFRKADQSVSTVKDEVVFYIGFEVLMVVVVKSANLLGYKSM
jgi:hypothetical protein